ncbi:NUDIX hydrolase family protein [Dictyostelium discoideum AX4]|uniref:8-oxo-dGTP diphosphatase n=1 Tax=Dictyostelium discoideum TaxID=44689 RepID=Q54BB8_DICDI|nr:NUDIX hydrolase family protein [Dictyostelium discoideum AX4]EAL60560.1 NUDIX hydrolase family protein [Dictyostelium discoideum AX4]|eukprot:XP_628976.1 NUDIX hydrolase family protein [Dictyostelium discoideum AX4]
MKNEIKKRVEVSVGIIENDKNEILICKRNKKGDHLYGLFEFPGGKIEKDETPIDCLIRELYEEVDIILSTSTTSTATATTTPSPSNLSNHNSMIKLIEIVEFEFKEIICNIHFFKVNLQQNIKPKPKENQPMFWIKKTELNYLQFPEPNKDIIQLLNQNKI